MKVVLNEEGLWLGIFLFMLLSSFSAASQEPPVPSKQKIFIEWGAEKPSGSIDVRNGALLKIEIVKGQGKVSGTRFNFASSGPARIAVEIDNVQNHRGSGATLVSVKTSNMPFSFFLRDVTAKSPIYISAYSVVVLTGSDLRSYKEIQSNIRSRHLRTKQQQMEAEPEASFESAAKQTLVQSVPTWLGISRDFRLFQMDENLPNAPKQANRITPKFAGSSLPLPGTGRNADSYFYVLGRGTGVEIKTERRLEDGVLPILHSTYTDGDIRYESTAFASLEQAALTAENVKGTHYLVADKYSIGHVLTEAQEEKLKPELEKTAAQEETVLYFQSQIANTGAVPRYAWLKAVRPEDQYRYRFEPATGFSAYAKDSIFCVSKLNGQPLHNEEMAVLLQPNEKILFEFYLPHSPISQARASKLFSQSYKQKLQDCKKFWRGKLAQAAQVRLPEKRIEEMLQAGLLHLDLITYGNEPAGTLAPCIGIYSPIGTESSPIIQFYNSMGRADIAKRSLIYFLDKQYENGFIQNFVGYMAETGAALYTFGEYFQYTHDTAWVRQIAPKLLKSCAFLLHQRELNKIDSLRGKGYGMIVGKVGDPEDPYHSFMLNGYACAGLKKVADMLEAADPEQSNRLQKEAAEWRNNIRESFFNALALGPVVPLGNGAWSPTAPPWPETTGPRSLYVNRETFFSHGTFVAHEELVGPMYLVFTGMLDADEPASKLMLEYGGELFRKQNAAFSQPYYSRHDWVQAKLHLVKPFLKMYYNTFSALADRETYTFWEHLYHLTEHKTHEEAWFLMQTRWMLYMEEGQTLRLLPLIPRKWMEDGKQLELKNVVSYFGPVSLTVNSLVNRGYIEAAIECKSDQMPQQIVIRLPHPTGKKPVSVSGGTYNNVLETVTISSFTGTAKVRIQY